jgi:hypothetical protein
MTDGKDRKFVTAARSWQEQWIAVPFFAATHPAIRARQQNTSFNWI